MSTKDTTFTCKARMTECIPRKGFVSVDGQTKGQEMTSVTMNGVKDEIFGPATPHFDLHMTIANPQVAKALRRAYEDHCLTEDDSVGVEFEVTFKAIGPSKADTYP